jgi:hypothetical protein
VPAVPPSTPHDPVAPQYWVLVVGSMQPPLQAMSGASQELLHCLFEQTEFTAHWFPHEPQLWTSEVTSTHSVPASPVQVVRLAAQVVVHLPPLHTEAATHAVLFAAAEHVPQLALSVSTSVHTEPHSSEPVPQVCPHLPLVQDSPLPHAFPHVPQLFESVFVS